ncbi:aldehyde:ferredoxin oxidoreductase, partial [Candidatus Bipolaricaulota bacterium]|nr:aldehyde:ferredoxin oxidoreductase [Candidatus Bipolaricaulota bacterium]
MNGVTGKILVADLSQGKTAAETLPDQAYRLFLGGFGLGAHLAWTRIPKGADPLGAQNAVAMVPGLLTGDGISTASKTTFTFRSPLTGTLARSVAGAWAGIALRKAGWDALLLRGASKSPVVLIVEDGQARFEDASDLWGLDTRATAHALRERFGEGYRTALIGPAGEALSRISTIECDGRQAGRGGGGAVFGAKKLKAILVKGTGPVPVHDREHLKKLVAHWQTIIRDHPVTKADMAYGSGEFLDWM